MSPFERYSRQIQVEKIHLLGQQKLNASSVLIVGAGGLGCQVGAQLAGAGIGKITIVDHDNISISNLHRQILFRESHIGQNKSLIASQELTKINSEIKIDNKSIRLNQSNVASLIDDASIVVDAADNFLTSYTLSDYCYANRVPLVSASVNSTFGWVGIFCGTNRIPAPSIRAVFPQLANHITNCDVVGVTGPSVGVIASIQAQETLKVAVEDKAQLIGKLLYLDLWNYQQHFVDFSNSQEPDQQDIRFVSTNEITPDNLVIDVRNVDEIIKSPFDFNNLLTIPLMDLSKESSSMSKDTPIVLACTSGQRALIGAQQLLKHQFEQISVLVPDD